MKKIISLIAISILLTSCGKDTIENETLTGSTSQSGSQIEENIDQNNEEFLSEETEENLQEENSEISEVEDEQESNKNISSQEDYQTDSNEISTPESQENNQTASGTITLEVEASTEISDTQEEQLIQETMDELNEFFELLEETNG